MKNMIKVKTFYVNDLRECCYVLYDQTGECVIVDPGLQTKNEQDRLVKFVEENNLKPTKIICTHGHFDHVMGNAFVTQKWGVPTFIHPLDRGQLERAQQYCQMFGYSIEQPPLENLQDLEEGKDVTFGDSKLQVIHSPGHTRGGVCFYSAPDNFIITGDSLFQGSIGRTDLPGGDYDALMESLLNKVCKIAAPNSVVYPGHGPETTIAQELNTNPFLRYE
jgi:Zn-dependent hydrolases, including glyoxylases